MKQYGEESNPWRFMSVTEEGHVKRNIRPISCLDDLNMMGWKVLGEDADADSCDQTIFIQLIRQMLKVDPAERIKPNQILQHQFVTMSHLVDKFGNSFHVKSCVEYMRNVQGDHQ
ncbi:homeodomain-interacting protein kinase 1-like [Melanotaenia boesemani]|uniref:homeodomain-interacting protein kinase 1-like n=1 Tax=Melanotaenia boesemani TaxID=1250792 RepID=UPI001C05696E|nr:homeodomain-interacting protein kinase 1-like [Melanotaenia boesemani]